MAARILTSVLGILKGLAGLVVGALLFAAILVVYALATGPIVLFLESYVLPDALSDETLFGVILAGIALVIIIVLKRIFWPKKPTLTHTFRWPDEDNYDPR